MPKPGVAKQKVLIVDDHPFVRQGLAQYLEKQPGLSVCGEAESIRTALQAIKIWQPHIVLVDLTLGEDNGLRLIETISAAFADIAVVVLSMHDETVYAERCLRAGAKGYVMKRERPEVLMTAIRKVLQGGIHVSERLGSNLLNRLFSGTSTSTIESLSNREFEIFQLIGEGLRTREMAERLNLSGKTIETHMDHIRSKLNLDSTRDIFKVAVEWRISQGGH